MSSTNIRELAQELASAFEHRQIVPDPPTARDAHFDLDSGYAVEADLVSMRRAAGHKTVGLKIGYANKAVWRALRMSTLVWAHMYDDTVGFAEKDDTVHVGRMIAPRIEPEIVFKLKLPLQDVYRDPDEALGASEWLALGFEIVDCVFPDWKFQPADFVAAYGCHAGLVIGKPRPIEPTMIRELRDQLADFKVTLSKDGQPAATGSGRNVLGNPALALAELTAAIPNQGRAEPLQPGDVITTGSLTDAQPIAPGQTWTATVEGLDLPSLTIRTTT